MDYHSPPTPDGTGSLAPFAERDPGSDPPRLREGEEVEITRKEKKGRGITDAHGKLATVINPDLANQNGKRRVLVKIQSAVGSVDVGEIRIFLESDLKKSEPSLHEGDKVDKQKRHIHRKYSEVAAIARDPIEAKSHVSEATGLRSWQIARIARQIAPRREHKYGSCECACCSMLKKSPCQDLEQDFEHSAENEAPSSQYLPFGFDHWVQEASIGTLDVEVLKAESQGSTYTRVGYFAMLVFQSNLAMTGIHHPCSTSKGDHICWGPNSWRAFRFLVREPRATIFVGLFRDDRTFIGRCAISLYHMTSDHSYTLSFPLRKDIFADSDEATGLIRVRLLLRWHEGSRAPVLDYVRYPQWKDNMSLQFEGDEAGAFSFLLSSAYPSNCRLSPDPCPVSLRRPTIVSIRLQLCTWPDRASRARSQKTSVSGERG